MIDWAIDTALAVSLLIAAVLLVRRPIAAQFGAHAAYALWLAPLLRAVTPPLPQLSLPVSAPSLSDAASYVALSTAPAAPADTSWMPLLIAIWLGGALAFLVWHLGRHYRFISAALQDGRPLQVAGVPYDVVASAHVDGPLATGLTHPLILVPADFTSRFDSEQQRIALCHEAMHHRRADIWASAAALLIAAALWFNPLTYLALGAFRRDMEASCDASVLARLGRTVAPTYAETILRCAITPVPRSLCALTSIDELKGRLTMLGSNVGSIRRYAGFAIAGVLAGTGVALAAGPDDQVTEVIEKKIVRHGGGDVKKVREFRVSEDLAKNCPGQRVEIDSKSTGDNPKKASKLIICTDEGEGNAEMIKALEKALADADKRDDPAVELSDDMKAKIRAKISELRAKS